MDGAELGKLAFVGEFVPTPVLFGFVEAMDG